MPYAGGSAALAAKALAAFGDAAESVSPRPGGFEYAYNRGSFRGASYDPNYANTIRSIRASAPKGFGNDLYSVDWFDRDESLYLGVPSELEMSGPNVNDAYAGMDVAPGGPGSTRPYGSSFSGYSRRLRGYPARRGLGAILQVASGAASLTPQGQVLGGITAVLSGLIHSDPNDPKRLAQNLAWYNAAIKGDRQALANLYTASGVGPPSVESPQVPYTAGSSNGTVGGGWATATATQDAADRYNAACKILGGSVATANSGLPAGWARNWTNDGTYVYLGPIGTGNVSLTPAGNFDVSAQNYGASHDGWLAQVGPYAAAYQATGVLPGGGGVAGSPNQPAGTSLLTSAAGMFGGSSYTTLALIGLGAFVLSKVFKK